MLHPQGSGKGDGAPQLLPAAPGQAQHQVQGDVFKARGPGVFHSQRRLLGRVGPAQKAQLLPIGGLQAHGKPVETRPARLLKKGPVHMGGVGLQGDFRPGG